MNRNSEVLNYPVLFKGRITETLPLNSERESENNNFTPRFLKKEAEELIPKQTITNVYGDSYDIIQVNLQNTELDTLNYFSNILNELNNKYSEFNSNINTHFISVTNKITEAFKLDNPNEDVKNMQRNSLIQKYAGEYINQVNKIINMYEKIFKHIKDSISLLIKFLDVSKNLDKEKPIQEFLSQEFQDIIENWLFLDIDFDNFDFAKSINQSKLDTEFKNFIFKICKDKNFVMNVSLPREYMIDSRKKYENLSEEIKNTVNGIMNNNQKIISDNHAILTKLTMNNIFYPEKYFDKDLSYKKMRYLKLNNVVFEPGRNQDNDFLENKPVLENLMINSSHNFEISILKSLAKSLIKLSLNKNGFVDYEFNNIMSNYLVKSDSIRKNLQMLSFAQNNLSNIDIGQIVYQPKQSFYALKELNFEKNKIYKFSISPEFFVELKCINCCSNCFTRSYFDQYPNILTLLSGNIFLSNAELAKNYFLSLDKKLVNSSISLSYLNISYLPRILGTDYLEKLLVNDSILINLKKLDLSHNNLDCNTIFKFLENNKGCLSLKVLNLSYNQLDDSFFEKYLDLKLNNIFTKLKFIYLDSNKFGTYTIEDQKNEYINLNDNENKNDINRFRLLYKFILENKNLVELSMTKNPMRSKIYLKKMEENRSNFNFNDFVKKNEKGEIIINCFYSLLWKIKMEILEENKNNKKSSNFNFKFDCANNNNMNSMNFDFVYKYIVFKNKA